MLRYSAPALSVASLRRESALATMGWYLHWYHSCYSVKCMVRFRVNIVLNVRSISILWKVSFITLENTVILGHT